MEYLNELGFTFEEINTLKNMDASVVEKITTFPTIISANYTYLKGIGIKNFKEVFLGHVNMFLINPDRFKAIFEKYDHADLIRCLEKNAAVIEKL